MVLIYLDKKLKTISEPSPNTRTIFIGKVLPFFKGNGEVNLLCGNCGAKLIEGLFNEGQIRNIVVKCPVCKFFSEIP